MEQIVIIIVVMSNKVQCNTHGEQEEAFVCTHLVGEGTGLGFHCDEPTAENPFPDAWCDNCELIREAHGEWNDEAQKLTKISLLCSGCYERTRIRNTRPTVTLDDLDDLRWKCGSCDEWHTGPCLDFSYDSPQYWRAEHVEADRKNRLRPGWKEAINETFINEDYCAIEDRDFFRSRNYSSSNHRCGGNFSLGCMGFRESRELQETLGSERRSQARRVARDVLVDEHSNS